MYIFMSLLCLFLVIILNILFFMASNKQSWDSLLSSSFECGFTSYFFSHFSFSIHYFMVSLIFLFFDLELCFIFPFMNESLSNFMIKNIMFIFVILLLTSLIYEWKEGKLDWIF